MRDDTFTGMATPHRGSTFLSASLSTLLLTILLTVFATKTLRRVMATIPATTRFPTAKVESTDDGTDVIV